jgi:Fe-S-cluster containining protein
MIQISSKNVCTSCKECCIFTHEDAFFAPVVTNSEKELINKKRKNPGIFEKKKNTWQIKLVDYKGKKVCPLLDTKTWLCGAYEDRPFDCKIFPYLLMWDANRETIVLAKIDDACPAFDNKTKAEQEVYLADLIKYLQSEKITNLLLENSNHVWENQNDFIPVMMMKKLTKLMKALD